MCLGARWALDPVVQKNFDALPITARVPVRIVGSLQFPEIGLGPLVRAVFDGIFVHDLQRDYYIRKFAAVPGITYSPIREVRISLNQSFEYNAVRIFNQDFQAFQRDLITNSGRDRLNSILVPDGDSFVSAQKISVAWDRRDNSFDATKGTLLGFSIEHVDAFSLNDPKRSNISEDGHFLKITETVAGYIPLYKRFRLAAQLRAGVNVQLTPDSVTYTDRLFFIGGNDSMRAWFPSSFIPQDDADLIEADQARTVAIPVYGARGASTNVPDPTRFTALSRPVRGGNLMFNPRVEMRIPIVSVLETALFADVANLWKETRYPFDKRSFPMRISLGTGVRLQTPVFPIAFDFGFNPWSRTYDDRTWAFNFSIGLF
jgi:outer membrane protein insertion porin family